jgi:hypothetical protein
MAFTFHDTLGDARSRIRFAVGDFAAPGLFADALYDAILAQSTTGDPPVVDEEAATRAIARGLAARFATQPTSISSNGKSLNWAERVAQWNRTANGEAGGAAANRAKGFRLKRGPATDYTTGGGDA